MSKKGKQESPKLHLHCLPLPQHHQQQQHLLLGSSPSLQKKEWLKGLDLIPRKTRDILVDIIPNCLGPVDQGLITALG